MTPGTQTPSEMEQAIELGLSVVKFFPAEPAGGLKMIKAVAAPYVGLQFMPTGGISAANVREYLKFDRIIACGGSWMVKADLVKAGKKRSGGPKRRPARLQQGRKSRKGIHTWN